MLAKKPGSGSRILLNTKLHIPALRYQSVLRTELIRRMNQGLDKKLIIVSAPAGYGKTTLVSEWASQCHKPIVWISLDKGDNDPSGFLLYLVTALKRVLANVGDALIFMLQSPQPPQVQWIFSHLINEISGQSEHVVLILDDYHLIENQAINEGMTFLLENLPAQMQMVLISRDVPELPLAQLRVRNQLTELHMEDLCFRHEEISEFLNQTMALDLSDTEIDALENRTEGWIAGLQLAALSLRGQKDASGWIQSFTGNHSFVMDYLLVEVLERLPERIQTFLLVTSMLERLSAPLCDGVLSDDEEVEAGESYRILTYLENANLFLIPLDDERKWYRYHHLFADLLRSQLAKRLVSEGKNKDQSLSELHLKACHWYSANGFEWDAFQHAVWAKDIGKTLEIINGEGLPLLFRGSAAPILNWLKSLTSVELDAHPALWIMYASAVLLTGQTAGVEEKLLSAERAISVSDNPVEIQEMLGNMAAIRASLAVTRHDISEIIRQSSFALSHVHPNNLSVRVTSIWALGYAYHLQRDLESARKAYEEAVDLSEALGHRLIAIMSRIGIGHILELKNDLRGAEACYRMVTALEGHEGYPVTCDAYLGLARIACEWNDSELTGRYLQKAFELAGRIDYTDRMILCELTAARLKVMIQDPNAAYVSLEKARQLASQKQYAHRMGEVVDQQVAFYLSQNDLKRAEFLVLSYEVPLSRIHLYLKREETNKALEEIQKVFQLYQERNWEQEMLKAIALKAIALHQKREDEAAVDCLMEALRKAEPGDFMRLFLDEGSPMEEVLDLVLERDKPSVYLNRIKLGFKAEAEAEARYSQQQRTEQGNIKEQLSERELEVLKLIAEGYSNQEISQALFLALSTVKGHNQRLFSKLQVESRTEAIARGRALGLL